MFKISNLNLFISLLIATLSTPAALSQNIPTEALSIIEKMLNTHKKINSLEMTMNMSERIEGSMNKKEAFFKIAYNPDRVYLKQDVPRKGLEVLYVDGLNNNEAWVYPNSFPWFTLSLDPYGKLMRHDHHHSVFNAGYKYTMNIVEYLLERYKNQINNVLTYNGKVKFKNAECYKVEFSAPDFKYVNYQVKPGETVVSIAKKSHLNEYMIIEKNNGNVDYEEPLDENIIVPTVYAQRVVFYINVTNNLPYKVEIYDDKGLFEEYTFNNVKINPAFKSEEFSIEYEGYSF